MRRWTFIGLIILMVVALLGIIWIQSVWIRNAVDVRNDLFNRSVFNSLQSTARKIESSRQLAFYEKMMIADSMLQSQANEMMTTTFGDRSYIMRNDETQLYALPGTTGESFSFRVTDDGGNVQISSDYKKYMVDPEGNLIEIKPGKQIIKQAGTEIDQEELSRWVYKKSEDLRRMGDRMVNEIYNWELETEINREELLSTLYNELNDYGIKTPFEFAILENNRIVDGVFNHGSETKFFSSDYSIEMFSDRLISNNTRLSLIFPDRKTYILGSMALLLSGSMLFSIIILLTFALSIYFIIRQKKISEMKSDFINNMTHEFKTPIATISLAADTISNPRIIDDNEKVKHFVRMIKKENTRMNKQVETILQISSLDKREIEFCFADTDMHSVISRSIETIEIQVEEKKGNIFFYPEAKDQFVYGDREHLMNLIHNLLDNANKYSPGEPEITVRTENRDGTFILSVEDKGSGMSKSVQSKIFERFYRQSSGNVHNVKGFGLGLNYVKAIVEAHNGDIQVYSEAGKGTKFEVFLPQTNNVL